VFIATVSAIIAATSHMGFLKRSPQQEQEEEEEEDDDDE